MIGASRFRIVLIVLFLLAPSIARGQGLLVIKPPPINPKLLQGIWEGVGPGGECRITISGASLRYEQPDGGGTGSEFWFETTLVIPDDADPQQFYATIVNDSSSESEHVGKVVVALFKLIDETLSLGVIDSLEEAPKEPLSKTWNDVMDEYTLKQKTGLKEPSSGSAGE